MKTGTSQTKPCVNSIMLMTTYACSFACDYCEVRLGSKSMPLSVMQRSIDLLLTTKDKKCQIRFWGGEPLLEWRLIQKAVDYAQDRAGKSGKSVRFMITTNGYLLDEEKLRYLKQHSFEVMLSFDGDRKVHDRHRRLKNGKGTFEKLYKNLKLLDSYGVPYFVNLVVTEATVSGLRDSLRFLNKAGIPKVQICYRCGTNWKKKHGRELLDQIDGFLGKNSRSDFLMNFYNLCEPTMLSQEVLIDTDGKIYYDAAIFLEKKFPALKKAYYAGDVSSIGSIDALHVPKNELYDRFYKACTVPQRKVFLNNIALGLKLGDFFKRRNENAVRSNEHPLVGSFVQRNFTEQNKLLKKIGLDALFLRIDGPCLNDCLFCKQKSGVPFEELFSIKERLARETRGAAGKICLIGNEPLLHPDIIEIVREIKKKGFSETEVMTSGSLLADPVFAKEIIAAGATSFSLPLFSDQARVHDHIAGRKGAFSKTITGIRNARKFGAGVFIHTNLIKPNIGSCLRLERFVKNELKLPFAVLPIRPKTSNKAFSLLMPAYSDMIEHLSGIESMVGFPLCVTRKAQKELFKKSSDISDSMKLYFLDQNFIKLQRCAPCVFLDRCAGIFKEYASSFPLDDIQPVEAGDEDPLY